MSGGGGGGAGGQGSGARQSAAQRRALVAALRVRNGGRGSGGGAGGIGGVGPGAGGVAPEAPDAQTGFTPERSRAMISAGRTLLQIEGQKNAPAPTPVTEAHRAALEAVKQGAADAVLRENIPAEYHEAIRRYFDDLGKAKPGK